MGQGQTRVTLIGVIEGVPLLEHEDSGQAMIAEVDDPSMPWWVRIHSWDSSPTGPRHPIESQLAGKRVRVTVEIIEL